MARNQPTSQDVARLAGVSRSTVSFVLNGREDIVISAATRERVLRAAEVLGYHANAFATQLARGASLTIGLALRQDPAQVASDALLPQTVQGLGQAARERSYEVLVESLPPGAGSYRRLLQSRRVGGLVISGPVIDAGELEQLYDEGFPVVIQGHLVDVKIPSVDVDNVAAARHAVRRLVESGHRRIAMITNAPLIYTGARERLDGYRKALVDSGLPFDSNLVVEGAFDANSGFTAMNALLEGGDFTALFVASDVVALGAMGAARAKGLRIPDDISVVGFDDIPLAAHFDPPLTTVRVPAYELGKLAGDTLLALIHGEPVKERTILRTAFKMRDSVRSHELHPA